MMCMMRYVLSLFVVFLLQGNIYGQLYDLHDISFCGDTWWAASYLPDSRFTSVIQKSTDFGKSWIVMQSTPGNISHYEAVKFADEKHGWAILDKNAWGTLLKTTDGGYTWENTGNLFHSLYDFYMDFKDNKNGFLITQHFVYRTSDGGNTWLNTTQFFPDGSSDEIVSISFPSDSVIYVVNLEVIYTWEGGFYNYSLFRTSDQGNTWTETIEPENRYFKVDFFSSDSGFIFRSFTRDSSLAYFTSNQGITLDSVNVIPKVIGSKFFNQQHGFITSSNVLYRTTDGLQTLDTVLVVDATFIKDFLFKDNFGLLTAYKITPHTQDTVHVYYSTDYGRTWSAPVISSVEEITAVEEFRLFQNYPNPFNPSTKIKYYLPERQLVKIKLFDVLGRSFGYLENATREAGLHEVVFNSEDFNLTSGIYFYSIEAGEYSRTRKMVLIK
jgi:hypothetical protein